MPRSTIEGKILQTYFAKLVSAIVNPAQLADALYSASLIDQSTRLDAGLASKNTLEKASKLLSAVERVISVSPDRFTDLLSILREQLTTESLLDEMEGEYHNNKTTPTTDESNSVRSRKPTAQSGSPNGTEDVSGSGHRPNEYSYWPAIKGIGSVAFVSLIIWMLCMVFYTSTPPVINLKNVQERMAAERTKDTSNLCHQLTNPSKVFEELQMEVSNALTLGIYLGLPKVKVDIIERENRSEAEKLIAVLQTCHDYDLCRCWEDIVRAVRKYGNQRKANELEQKYVISNDE